MIKVGFAAYWRAALLFVLSGTIGCGGSSRLPPADADVAKTALERTLKAWQDAAGAESLANASPPIIAFDPDWGKGVKLVGFEIAPSNEPFGNDRRFPVTLKLQNKSKPIDKKVTYLVGTQRTLTVYREEID